tara:strand:+ start:3742 stop:3975 length:234 start_codon:yes stop_codon:yes gene_type:complete
MSFLMPKMSLPPMPAPPPPPPPAPTRDSEDIAKAKEAERERLQRMAGRKASIMTTSRGLLDDPDTASPSLIGQKTNT